MAEYIVLRIIGGRVNVTTRCAAPTADDAIAQAVAKDVEFPGLYGDDSNLIEYRAYSIRSDEYRAIDWRSQATRANLGLMRYSPVDELMASGAYEARKTYRINNPV